MNNFHKCNDCFQTRLNSQKQAYSLNPSLGMADNKDPRIVLFSKKNCLSLIKYRANKLTLVDFGF